jgi:hypothetical protein
MLGLSKDLLGREIFILPQRLCYRSLPYRMQPKTTAMHASCVRYTSVLRLVTMASIIDQYHAYDTSL